MPTPVTGRCNLHSAATYGQPLGVRCRSCERRVLVPLDKISARGSDMTPLHTLPLKCAACGGREVTLFAIDSQAELVAIQQAMAGPREPAQAPTTHARSDPDAGLP